MNYSDILNLVFLLFIACLAYVLLVKLLQYESNSKRKRLSRLLNEGEKKSETLKRKYPFVNYMIPSFVMGEAEKYNREYHKRTYATHFLIGTAIGVVVFLVYFKVFLFLIPISVFGGFIATLIHLHSLKRDYIQETDHNLSEYMSSFTTAYGTFGNLRGAISSILPSVDKTIQIPLESAYIRLGEGKSVKQAFYDFEATFPQKYVRLFHVQVQALEDSGSNDTAMLRKIANKMKKKQVFKRDLLIVNRSQFKRWRLFLFLVFSLPLMFLVFSYDNFILIQNNVVSNIVMFLSTLYSLFVYKKIIEVELYDPTEN